MSEEEPKNYIPEGNERKPNSEKEWKDLSRKQQKFIKHYLGEAELNACKAADMAGYKHARSAADEARKHPAIQRIIHERLEDVMMSKSEVLAEMSKLAKADTSDDDIPVQTKKQALDSMLKELRKWDEKKKIEHSYDEDKVEEEIEEVFLVDEEEE